MAEITEVNPWPLTMYVLIVIIVNLKQEVMPRAALIYRLKKCPQCKTLMKGEGQNIPFATFLGFNAEKSS